MKKKQEQKKATAERDKIRPGAISCAASKSKIKNQQHK
jgi:hypothetical protein